MSYENIWEEGGVYRRYSNSITGKEILQSIQDVQGHSQFDSISYVINDLRYVTAHDVSLQDLKTIAAIDKASARTNPNIKIAIVSTMPKTQNMANMYGELIGNDLFTCEVFANLDDAREWAI